MHNTEPIISAPGNGEGIDHPVPQGALRCPAPASACTLYLQMGQASG